MSAPPSSASALWLRGVLQGAVVAAGVQRVTRAAPSSGGRSLVVCVSSTVPSTNLARPIVPKEKDPGEAGLFKMTKTKEQPSVLPLICGSFVPSLRLPRLPNQIHEFTLSNKPRGTACFPTMTRNTTPIQFTNSFKLASDCKLPPITQPLPHTQEGEREEACVCPRVEAALLGAVGKASPLLCRRGSGEEERGGGGGRVYRFVRFTAEGAAAAGSGSTPRSRRARTATTNHAPTAPLLVSRAENPWPRRDLSLPLPVGGDQVPILHVGQSVEHSKRKNNVSEECRRRCRPVIICRNGDDSRVPVPPRYLSPSPPPRCLRVVDWGLPGMVVPERGDGAPSLLPAEVVGASAAGAASASFSARGPANNRSSSSGDRDRTTEDT
jgi:hypothetical protein